MLKPLRVIVVDDDPVFRDLYQGFFVRDAEFECVGVAENGRRGVALWRKLRPDVTLMDLNMPQMPGIEAIRIIREEDPSTCVIALTAFDDGEYVGAALNAGANGYLMKGCSAEDLRRSVHDALANEMPLSATVRQTVVSLLQMHSPRADQSVAVTPREDALLRGLARGLSNQRMAEEMNLSRGSIKLYLSNLFVKFQVKSRSELLAKAMRLGFVGLGSAVRGGPESAQERGWNLRR